MTAGGEKKKVKVERTEYVARAKIFDPYAEEKLETGEGNCIILHTGARGDRLETDQTETLMLGYDEYLRCLVYMEIPEPPRAGTLDLAGRSFVQILGRYDQPTEKKIFSAHAGLLVIDSLAKGRLFGTIDGDYRNPDGVSVEFSGKFKVRIAD
jgi:hypothetical protein